MINKFLLSFIAFSVVLTAASVPKVTGDAPGSQLVGEDFTEELCFENAGDAIGYSPQLEIVTPPGIVLNSSDFQGINTLYHTEVCQAAECNVTNPATLHVTTIDGNETFYVLQYPIGSFASTLPKQCLNVTYHLDQTGQNVQLGTPLDINVVPLFSLGETAVDDGNFTYGTLVPFTVEPNVITLKKHNNAREGESATGPSYPIVSTLEVDIANGETVDALTVTDTLDSGMHFISVLDDTGCNSTTPSSSPGGTLVFDCGSVTGVSGIDKIITYNYYIDENDTNGDPVLGTNGQHSILTNQAVVDAEYAGNPLPQATAEANVTAMSITIYKTSEYNDTTPPAGLTPGDPIKYILILQTSDYFEHNDLNVSDLLADGQSINYGGAIPAEYTLDGTIYDINETFVSHCSAKDPVTGTCEVDFNLSGQMDYDGLDATLASGKTVTITFQAIVDANYTVINNGDPIAMGDVIGNSVTVYPNIPGVGIGTPDSSSKTNEIASEQFIKEVYAINGTTGVSAPYEIHPGDTVTYRLKSVMPVRSFYDYNLTDFLPSPFFNATEVTDYDDSTTPPPAGKWGVGPDNNYSNPPILSTDATDNKVIWTFGDDTENVQSTVLDILFTVTATMEPMADSLQLVNIAITEYKNAAGIAEGSIGFVPVVTQEPSLVFKKSIILSSNPDGTLIAPPTGYDSAMQDVDAGDIITYKIHLENIGRGTAYDINITDRFAQGGIDGAGLESCGNIQIDTNSSNANGSGDLFNGIYTIDILDPSSYYDINYTCTIKQDASPGEDIDNNVTLTAYANSAGGPNFVNKLLVSKAKLMIEEEMSILKSIASTSIPDTSGSSLNQGEIVYFDINITLGEGNYTNFSVSDNTCANTPVLQSQSSNVVVDGTTVSVTGTSGSVDGNLSYRCEKQMIADGTNTATVTADIIGTKTAQTSWTVVAPAVVTGKRMNPSRADAGDTVTVTMKWTNDPAHPAYKCKVTDPLNTSVFDISTVAITKTPSDYTCSISNNEVICEYDGNLSLPCSDGPAEFTVKVRDDVNTSARLTNELSFTGVTLPDGHTGENNTTLNGSVESNATARLTLQQPVRPVKIFTATSEDFTDPGDMNLNNIPDVAVGEVIDVQITYGFYQGTTLNVFLDDILNDGGQFAYVPGTMTISRSATGLTVADSEINASLSSVAVGTQVPVDDAKLELGTRRIRLPLGNVSNNDVNGSTLSENLVLQFRIKVQNETLVQAGYDVRDRGITRFDDWLLGKQRSSYGNILSAKIVEPLATILKDVNQTSVEAGTSLAYTIKVCNDENNDTNNPSHATSGFDWNVTDRIPDEIALDGTPSVRTGTTGADVNITTGAQEINATIDRLDRGECVYIDYNATVRDTAHYGQILTNTVQFQTTSLPGKYGMAGKLSDPNAILKQEPGERDGERIGDGSDNELNDLHGETTSSVTVDEAAILKRLESPKQFYAIGDKAHYRILIGLPKGEANATLVQDTLPDGLDFNASEVSFSIDSNLSVENNPPLISQNGQIVTFDFGNIYAANNSMITIDYNVTVANIISNQDNTPLLNDANISYDDPNNIGARITQTPTVPADKVTVGEPNLFMQKKITLGAVDAQAGSTVSWEVEITNTGHTTAYAVDWNDTLPPHLANITNGVLTLSGTPAVLTGTTTELNTSDLIENNQTITLPKFDLPTGSTVTVTFESTVTNDAVAGETQTNETFAKYRSLLDGVSGARDGSQCGDDDDDSTLDNYCESAREDLVIDAKIAIDKHLQGTSDLFTIGKTVTYDLRIWLIQGRTTNVVLSDRLPDGLQYVSHTHQAGASGMFYDTVLADMNSGSGQQIVIEFGDVNNTADGNLSNDYIDIELEARVVNILSNQNDVNLSNGDPVDSPVSVSSDANSSAVNIPVEIKVTEPSLNVSKKVNPDTQALGDVVTYRIEIGHDANSTSDAYDVNLTDTLPVGLTYIPGSASGTTVSQNGQVLTFGFAYIAQGDTKVVTYQARIDQTATVGADLNNSLDAVFSSLADANGTLESGRNGQDGMGDDNTTLNNYARHAQAKVVPNRAILDTNKTVEFKEDTNNDGLINAGDHLEYNLSVENNLGYAAGDINISDSLNPDLTLLLNTIKVYHNNSEIFNADSTTALDWNTTTDYWYHYANGEFEINYYGDTNYFELYWHNELDSGDTLDVLFNVKINDGNLTTVMFGDSTTLDINKTQNTYVNAGIIINNTFTTDSNRTIPVSSNEVNVTTDQRGIAGTPSKRLTGTDQSFTDPGDTLLDTTPPAAIGEVVDIELIFGFSGGTTKNVVLKDNFDPKHFVRTGAAQLERNCTDMWVGDFNSTYNANGTDIIHVEDNITSTSNGFELNIGDIFNPNYQEMNMTCNLKFTFSLRVDNNASVQRGVVLEDNASVTFDRYISTTEPTVNTEYTSPNVGVRAVTPNVKVEKSVDISTAKVGDVRKYTLKICDENATDVSAGYEWNILDTVPDELLPDGNYSFDANGTAAVATGGFTGQELNVTIDTLQPGECVSISFDVTVTGLAEFEQQIRNDVNLTATSLPGVDPYERTGLGGINDLNTTDHDTLSIDAPIIKKDVTGRDKYYAIGDVVQHRITLSFPASTGELHIIDLLPEGLAYIPMSAKLTTPADVNVSNNPPLETIDTVNNIIDFYIGDLNVSKAGDLYLDINATVTDIDLNYDGITLRNDANMTFVDPNTGLSGELNTSSKTSVTIGEPNLLISKSLTNYDPNNPKGVGDLLNFRIVIENTGTTWAYHVNWEDEIPAPFTGQIQHVSLNMPTGDVYETNTTTPLTDNSFIVSPDENISLPPFDIPDGRSVVITFDTAILALTSQTIVNHTAAATQSTLMGGRTDSVPNGGAYKGESSVPFTLNQLPEADNDGCYLVTAYADYVWDIGANDKLGDGTKAEHTWRVVKQPANGTVTISKDGIATYRPNANFNGNDSFVYELEDLNGDKSEASVCITVDCASSQTSDGGDAFSLWSMLMLITLTGMMASYFMRKEEEV